MPKKGNRGIRANVLIKLTSELVGRVATFGLALWAARRLGEADFGLYSYGLALGFVLAQLADMGLQILVARDVAIAGKEARDSVRIAFRLKLLLSAPVVLLMLLISSGRPLPVQLSFLALGLAMLAQTFVEFVAYVFRGQQRLQTEARLLAGARLATAIVGVLVLWLGGGLVGLAVSSLTVAILAAVWALHRLEHEGWLRFAAVGDRLVAGETVAVTGRLRWSQLLRQALPLGVATFLSIAFTRMAIIMLEYRLDEVAVAQFSAAQRLVEPTQLLPAAVLAAVFPLFVNTLHNDPAEAGRLARRSSLLLAVAGAVLALALWLGAPILIPLLYGQDFRASIPVLRVLGLSILPAFINYSLTHYLIARGQQLLSSLFVALMLITHGLLSWRLMATIGAVGPAVGVVVAEMILMSCCLLTLLLTKPAKLGTHLEWQTSS